MQILRIRDRNGIPFRLQPCAQLIERLDRKQQVNLHKAQHVRPVFKRKVEDIPLRRFLQLAQPDRRVVKIDDRLVQGSGREILQPAGEAAEGLPALLQRNGGLEKDTVLELNFNAIPEELGVGIVVYMSLTKTGWSPVFADVLRQGTTWCRVVAGVSEKAYYKVETTVEPTSASYE